MSLAILAKATVSDKSAEVLEESTKKKRKSKSLKQNGDEEDSVSSKKKKKTLVIVESPAKAKTIQKILNSEEYIVESCYGHVRDLCKSVRVVEEDYLHGFVSKDLRIKVGTLGVDVYNNFAPIYVAADKQAVVIERLRKLARGCDLIVLATDEDREGEAISWHLLEVLKPKAPHKRAVFHEITKTAILESFQNLRDIDMNLVQSQETRRILDRLTGYTLSPVLWRYISFGMSAGRVQSCGLKLIVDRERKRWDFISGSYYSVLATLYNAPADSSETSEISVFSLPCKLYSVNGQRVAGDKDFDDSTGALKDTAAESIEGTSKGNVRGRAALSQPLLLTEETTVQLLSWLSGATQEEVHTGNSEGSTTFVPAEFRVTDIDQKQVQRSPPLPLITSSLQQEASSKLSLSPARTMSIAQELYEKGYISYMRTDSPKLSQLATDIGTSFIKQTFGDEYLGTSAAPSQTKKKAPAIPKNAQEAHEAIRPAVMETAEGVSRFYQPNEISFSSDMHRALYVLILQRTLASLMGPSISDTTTFTITARRDDSSTETIKNTDSATFEDVKLRTSVTSLRFKGYTAAYDLWPNTAESSTGEFVFQHYVDNKQPDEPSPFASVSENDRLWLHTSSANSLATWTPDENENLSNGNTNSESEVESNGEESKLTSTTDTDTASGPGLLSISGVRGTQHHTRPPTRFTEASFIRELEEIGVGRPSTYSAIFQKLKEREYVLVDKRSIMPTVRGILVTNLLEQHFLSVVDSNFTAIMESQLDSIAKGQRNKLDFLQQFYLGSEEVNTGLLPRVEKLVARDVIDHTESRTIRLPFLKDIDCEVVLASSGLAIEKVNPDGSSRTRWGLPPNMQLDIRELTSESIRTVMETQLTTEGTSLGAYDNGDGGGPRAVYIRSGRFGKYLQLGENFDKLRRTYSLPSWVDENTDKSDLLSFIEFPKTVCVHPTLNIPIEAEVKFGHMHLKFFGFTFEREVFNIMPRELTPEFALNMFSDLNESSWKDMYLGDLNGTPILMFPTKSKKGYYLRSGSMFAQLNSKEKEELTLASAVEILRMKGRILGGKNKTPKVIKPQEKPTGKPTGRPRKVVESVKADSSTETLPKEILSRKEKKAKPRVDKSKKSTKVKPEKLATKSTTVNKSPTTKTIKTSKPVLNGYCRFLNQCTAKGIKFKEALSKWQGMTADEKLLL